MEPQLSKRGPSQELITSLEKNQQSIVVMAPNEFVDFAIVQKKRAGMSDSQISKWMDSMIQSSKDISASTKQAWNQYKTRFKDFGSFLPVFSDTKALALLALEMQRGGHLLSKYRIKTYNGRSYVMLQGYAGLRTQLTGTRYLSNNPKVVSMAIGKLGVRNAIKGGVVISVVFSIAFHALDQLMNDQATWHDFVAGVTVDVVSAATGAAIAWSVVATVIGGTAMAAIGPIAVVVVVGAGLTAALNAASNHFQVTEKLTRLLKEAEKRMLEDIRAVKREFRRGLNYSEEDPIGFMHRLFGLPYRGMTF